MKRVSVIFIVILTALSFSMCSQQNDKEIMIIIHTDYGNIKAKLYNETPIHRDNFISLVKKGWYNNSPFHRVIQNFMIQGGQNANGELGPGYQIDAEFNPALYHKKGALAAARQGDHVNPEKKSSGSQFYIVQGKTYSDAELDAIETKINHTFTPQQREIYKTKGGTPFLDMNYTVFGEVVEGFDVIDKIAAVETGARDKPVKETSMSIEIVK